MTTFKILLHNEIPVDMDGLFEGFTYLDQPQNFPATITKEEIVEHVGKKLSINNDVPNIPEPFKQMMMTMLDKEDDHIGRVMKKDRLEKMFKRFKKNLDQCELVEVTYVRVVNTVSVEGSIELKTEPLHIDIL